MQPENVTVYADQSGNLTDIQGNPISTSDIKSKIADGVNVSYIEQPVDPSTLPANATSVGESTTTDQSIVDRIEDRYSDIWSKLTDKELEEVRKKVKEMAIEIPASKKASEEYWNQEIQTSINIDATPHNSGGSNEEDDKRKDFEDGVVRRLKTQINWADALDQFITRRSTTVPNWRRPKKRAFATRVWEPKRKRLVKLDKFIICIDASGSVMGTHAYHYFINEVLSLFMQIPEAEATVVYVTTEVVGTVDVDSSNIEKLLNTKVPSGGGIELSALGYYIAGQEESPAGVAVLTDGYVSDSQIYLPKKLEYGDEIPYVFFVVPGGRTEPMKPFGDVWMVDTPGKA